MFEHAAVAAGLPVGGVGPATVDCSSAMSDGKLRVRRARRQDVPAIVRLLASDPLGAARETSGTGELPEAYWQAFEAIDPDPRQVLDVGDPAGPQRGRPAGAVPLPRLRAFPRGLPAGLPPPQDPGSLALITRELGASLAAQNVRYVAEIDAVPLPPAGP